MSDNSSDQANSPDQANSSDKAGAEPVAWLRVATPYAGYADAVVADIADRHRRLGPGGSGTGARARRSILIERPSVRSRQRGPAARWRLHDHL
jgi:hypothetical protein